MKNLPLQTFIFFLCTSADIFCEQLLPVHNFSTNSFNHVLTQEGGSHFAVVNHNKNLYFHSGDQRIGEREIYKADPNHSITARKLYLLTPVNSSLSFSS